MNRLGTTLKPIEVNPDEYMAIYFTGGHGVIWDFPENEALQSLSRKIYENGGYVSSVCHGAVGLLNMTLSDGTILVKDKKVTGFSNEEEKLAELEKVVPFLTETELVKRGGSIRKLISRGLRLRLKMPGLSPGRTRHPAVPLPTFSLRRFEIVPDELFTEEKPMGLNS